MFIVMRESNVENLASFHVIGLEDASWTWISFFTNFTSWFHVLPVSFSLDLALSLPARRGSVVLSSVFPCHFMFKEKLLSRYRQISFPTNTKISGINSCSQLLSHVNADELGCLFEVDFASFLAHVRRKRAARARTTTARRHWSSWSTALAVCRRVQLDIRELDQGRRRWRSSSGPREADRARGRKSNEDGGGKPEARERDDRGEA